jgi:pentose-5-phosphate-3-epimerase
MPAAALHHSCHPFDRGVSLNPAAPVVAVKEILTDAGLIQVMIFDLGFGSQELIPATLRKVSQVAGLAEERHPDLAMAVEGGMHEATRAKLPRRGPTVAVAGSAVFGPLARSAEPPRARFEEYAETLAGAATSSPRRTGS